MCEFCDDVSLLPSSTIEYIISDPGWALRSDLVAGSQYGAVSFVPRKEGPGCKITREAGFDVRRFRFLYQTVTEFAIGTAAQTVAKALDQQGLLTVRTRLYASDPSVTLQELLKFFWVWG